VPFQERLGGRIALVSEINIPGDASLVSYNLHLESRGDHQMRVGQLNEVITDARTFASARPTIIAGDLNLDASKSTSANAIAREGFIRAVPSERFATTPARHLLEPGRHIDWAFVRGRVQIDKGYVHSSIKASDHYPISFDLDLSGGR
jgi:endonuclease/exonuclease/phosphatase family metal-dependent hydrolase